VGRDDPRDDRTITRRGEVADLAATQAGEEGDPAARRGKVNHPKRLSRRIVGRRRKY